MNTKRITISVILSIILLYKVFKWVEWSFVKLCQENLIHIDKPQLSLLFAFCSNYFEPSLIKRFDAREEKIIFLSYLYASFEKWNLKI